MLGFEVVIVLAAKYLGVGLAWAGGLLAVIMKKYILMR
jgi:hypothetical protein